MCVCVYILHTVNVVHFEQELDFVFGRLAGKLLDGVDEFGQRYRSRVVFVEDLKHAIGEEWLITIDTQTSVVNINVYVRFVLILFKNVLYS